MYFWCLKEFLCDEPLELSHLCARFAACGCAPFGGLDKLVHSGEFVIEVTTRQEVIGGLLD